MLRKKELTDSLPVGNRACRAPDGGRPWDLLRGGGRADRDDSGSSDTDARETRPTSEGAMGWVEPGRRREGTGWGAAADAIGEHVLQGDPLGSGAAHQARSRSTERVCALVDIRRDARPDECRPPTAFPSRAVATVMKKTNARLRVRFDSKSMIR